MWSDSSAKDKRFINLIQVGWNNCPPASSYSHFRDMYIIHIIKSGSCTVEIGGHRYNLDKNEAFLVRPNQLAVQTIDSAEPCELYYFAFRGAFANDILEKTSFKGNKSFSAITDKSIYETIKNIVDYLDNHLEYEIVTFEFLFKMLSYFDKNNSLATINKVNNDYAHQKHISKVQEYIQQNYAKEIRVSELATQLGLSRSHLFRIFKNYTGKSIEEYIVSVRINTARSLLVDTDLSCSSVAMTVGYAHYTTFFKMFKTYTGLTPQQYRAKSKNEVVVKK